MDLGKNDPKVKDNFMAKMHADEFEIDIALVQRLVAEQFPKWAELSLKPVPSAGTDNALFRLGNEMVVRLPRIDWAVENVDKEFKWLPQLAPLLPDFYSSSIGKGRSYQRISLALVSLSMA